MALGSFAAIGQKNIKRLMAYSSIGHMGFALVGLASGTVEGAQGVLVYIAIYVAMTLGTFAVILSMKRNGQAMEQISDFAGLSRTNPLLAFFFAMLLFSLAGIPPLAGFFAKWYVFVAAIKAGLFTLAVIGVLTSVVGAFYYLTIIKVMYFDEPAGEIDPMRIELRTVLAVAGHLQHLLLRLSGAAGQRRHGGGEVAVLDDLLARSQGHIGGLPARRLRPDRFDQRRSHVARPRRRARSDVVRHDGADGGPGPPAARLGRAARQPRQQRARGHGCFARRCGDHGLCLRSGA